MPPEYESPLPVVCCAVVRNGHLLVIKRAIEPCVGLWALPAGYIEPGETAEEAVAREVKEETDLDVRPRYIGSFGKRTEQASYLSLCFAARTENEHVRIDEESSAWQWLPLTLAAIEALQWAFPNHKQAALDMAADRFPEPVLG